MSETNISVNQNIVIQNLLNEITTLQYDKAILQSLLAEKNDNKNSETEKSNN